jgi:hypothetical protein
LSGGCKGGLRVKGINARSALVSLFLGLAPVTPGQAQDYYIYHDPHGKLFISNQEPPPGSKIAKRLPSPMCLTTKSLKVNNLTIRSQTDRRKAHRSRPRTSRSSGTFAYNNGFKPVDDCSLCRNRRRLLNGLHMESDSSLRLAS